MFKHQAIVNEKAAEHVSFMNLIFCQECDNDYASDGEQVSDNKKTLRKQLVVAMRDFTIKDPLEVCKNLEEGAGDDEPMPLEYLDAQKPPPVKVGATLRRRGDNKQGFYS